MKRPVPETGRSVYVMIGSTDLWKAMANTCRYRQLQSLGLTFSKDVITVAYRMDFESRTVYKLEIGPPVRNPLQYQNELHQ